MKYYKFINLDKQHLGAIVVPEKGWQAIQESKSLKNKVELLGECDAGGTLLTQLSEDNFLKKAVPVKTIPVKEPEKKPEPLNKAQKALKDQLDDWGPPTDLQDFKTADKSTSNNNGKQRRESEIGNEKNSSKKAGTTKRSAASSDSGK